MRPHIKQNAQASIQPSTALRIPEKAPRILPVCRSLSALVGRKQTVVRDQLFSSRFAPLILAHRELALSWLVDDRAALCHRRFWCVPTLALPPSTPLHETLSISTPRDSHCLSRRLHIETRSSHQYYGSGIRISPRTLPCNSRHAQRPRPRVASNLYTRGSFSADIRIDQAVPH